MTSNYPAILHHKYSLEDGHVTPQIFKINGYRGIMLTEAPFKSESVISLKEINDKPGLIKQLKIVGVHVHHGSLAHKFHFLKKKFRIPLFVGFRGKDATAYPKKAKNLKRLKSVFKTGDRFFPVCKHLKKQIIKLGCPKAKIRVLYGGVDLERFQYRTRKLDTKKKIYFLAIGRFVDKKGFSELIRAFALVKKRIRRAKLILIGKGPCETKYRKLIEQYKLSNSVKIIPWIDYRKIQDKYHGSHIFCAPSYTDREGNQEGIPNTLKEAMATGMPVVSTTHAGIPELVKHKVSGLLVPERSVSKLAKAMIWLAKRPKKWESFGRNARKKIEKDFNLKRQLRKQKTYYDEVLSKHG
ncbi:glycosyltransferase [Paenibacillus agricola]|uniref:Colanic acid biosynthesis glycosyltransferase WcaL n=1 Tax=Paenibacillus agricola TaxID=2716264 RepID=A0ABX0J1K3_9BACL|nr:glycosyltransferase [Paenibacillus agricola]NHN30202.1 colanic acid biosynthesis glycosyltransferase WcaL [Paenibacillus agricola]